MRSAIEVGDLVWNGCSGSLRFGTVVEKRIDKSGWAYYTVEWHDDEKYQKVQKFYSSLNSTKEYDSKEFRSGQIHRVFHKHLKTIAKAYEKFNS